MDALRVWTERAAKRETSGDDAVCVSSATLQHRTAGKIGNRGGIVADCLKNPGLLVWLTTGSSAIFEVHKWPMRTWKFT